jgi:uncharacterized membrane protein
MENKEIDQLLNDQNEHISKLHHIVLDTIKEEKLIINNLLHPQKDILTPGQSISDKVARFGGSWKFIILFGIILTLWILFNVTAAKKYNFDPYPFILMNLILSCIAAMQAPIIMMSQNRQEEKDRISNENDYLINLKAEMQIRSLHQKMDLLIEEQIKTIYATQSEQFAMLQNIILKLDTFTVTK